MDPVQKLYNQTYYQSKLKPKRTVDRERQRSLQLQRDYGITITTFKKILEEQGFKCAICEVRHDHLPRGLSVDHCHQTNEVRGLLCPQCNTFIGLAQDNPLLLQRAIAYLCKTHPENL